MTRYQEWSRSAISTHQQYSSDLRMRVFKNHFRAGGRKKKQRLQPRNFNKLPAIERCETAQKGRQPSQMIISCAEEELGYHWLKHVRFGLSSEEETPASVSAGSFSTEKDVMARTQQDDFFLTWSRETDLRACVLLSGISRPPFPGPTDSQQALPRSGANHNHSSHRGAGLVRWLYRGAPCWSAVETNNRDGCL